MYKAKNSCLSLLSPVVPLGRGDSSAEIGTTEHRLKLGGYSVPFDQLTCVTIS